MIRQELDIDGRWMVTVLYDVQPEDLPTVANILGEMGATTRTVGRAVSNLRGWNAGITYTPFDQRRSLVCIGRAQSLRQMLNTVDHEIDHVQDHVCRYYGCRLGTEEAAYLQGYIGGRLFSFLFSLLSKVQVNP